MLRLVVASFPALTVLAGFAPSLVFAQENPAPVSAKTTPGSFDPNASPKSSSVAQEASPDDEVPIADDEVTDDEVTDDRVADDEFVNDPIADVEIEDTVITATRQQRRSVELPLAISAVNAPEFRRRLSSNTPDALKEELGVVVQKTNLGGGSPILRGRSGKSVLILLDGRRFNTSTYRRNNQYLNTIGLSALERLEVVRGPASVLYGSDAMGGAINAITRRREPTGVDQVSGRLFTQFESATQGYISHLGFEGELGNTGFTAGFTRRQFGDLRAGTRAKRTAGSIDRSGRQNPTGYDEYDFDFSLSRRLADSSTIVFLLLHTRQEDVPRSDRLIGNEKRPVPPDLRREVDPQILRFYEARYRYEAEGDTLESFHITATFNNPEETRRRVSRDDPTTLIREQDRTGVLGLSAQFNLRPGPQHLWTTGFDADYEKLNSRRETSDLNTGIRSPSVNGRYPDDAVYQGYGLYFQDEWQLREDLRWTNGVRYSHYRTRFNLRGLVVGPLGPFGRQSESYDDFTFSSALSKQVNANTWVYASISRGFRAPNLDDLAVLGEFASGERVPNTNLDPEKVWNFEAGVKVQEDGWRGGLTAAYSRYQDLFDDEIAFSLNGTDFFQVANRSRARIVSLEAWFERVMIESVDTAAEHSLFAEFFSTWGRNTRDDEPLRRIPPAQARLGWRTEAIDGKWSTEIFMRGALQQNRLSASDKSDSRIPLGGSPAWATMNLRGTWQVDEDVLLTAGLENLFDRRYRVHGSGIDAPGLNAVIAVDWRF